MNTFMGPMTPPPASPGQPQKLDIRTNPNQRAGFKQFMKQRTAPAVMPIQQMPQAQPMPMPMMQPRPQMPLRMEMGGDVDIFDPQNYHEGGLVNTLGQLGTMSGQMVDALNTIVMGGGQGGGATSGFDSGSGFTSTPSVSPTTPSVPPVSPATPDFVNPNVLSSSGGQTDPQAILNSQMSGGQGSVFTEGQPTPSVFPSGPSGNAPADDPRTPQNEYQDFITSGVSDTPMPSSLKGAFDEQGNPFNLPATINNALGALGMKDGGAVPPRRTEIGGQPHMLSYITPDEADILEALGGSGEPGPMGIPAFDGHVDGADPDSGPGAAAGFGNDDGPDDNKSGGGQDRSGMQSTLDSYQDQSAAEKAADFAKAAQAGKDARDQAARDLVARTFATSDGGRSLVGAPGSKTGFATTGKPSQQQINDALAAAKSLGFDISGSQTATDLGLNDPDDGGIEAVSTPSVTEDDTSLGFGNLLDLLALDNPVEARELVSAGANIPSVATSTDQFTSPKSANLAQQRVNNLVTDAANASTRSFTPIDSVSGAVPTGDSSTPATDFFADAYSDIVESATKADPDSETIVDATAPGTTGRAIMDIVSPVSTIGIASQILGLDNQFTQPKASPADRSAFAIGELLSLDDRARDINKALESGMFDPTGGLFGTGKVTDIRPEGLEKGFFSTNPFGMVVYTGPEDANYTGPYRELVNPPPEDTKGGPPPVKQPFDPCPQGFVLKDGVCTPIETNTGDGTPNQIGGGVTPPTVPGGPVVVPSTRPTGPFNLQGPVGYGVPTAGMADPSVATNAALYQQMLNQQAAAPIRLQSGGPVSSNLDRAADNFLKSLMPTA